MEKYQDKARGMLIGLAVGDALGAPYEFGYSSDRIKRDGNKIAELQESMAYPAGAWTDDTSMALCIADSLLEKHGYNSYDIMYKFSLWLSEGYRTFDGRPALDVGIQTANAIENYLAQPVISKNARKTESAGNGAIMRLAPIILAGMPKDKKCASLRVDNDIDRSNRGQRHMDKVYDIDLTGLTEMAVLSCRETHNSYAAEVVTEMFSIALFTAIYAEEKSDIRFLSDKCYYLENQGYDEFRIYHNGLLIDRAYNGSPEELSNLGGYIVDTFAIALWGLMHSDTFEEGMIKVIRLGGDTDTNAACYGQLAGAYYGYKAIPEKWRDNVCKASELVEIADELFSMKECPIIKTRFEDNEHFERKAY